MKKISFTLIELLIVCAIILILTSILLPALGKARKLATRMDCAQQLKSITLANSIYATDNNEYFHKRHCGPCSIWWWTNGHSWHGNNNHALYPYLNVDGLGNILFCKSAVDEEMDAAWMKNLLSYRYNNNFHGGGVRRTQIQNTANVFMFSDAKLYISATNSPMSHIRFRHSKSANISFVDGHVKAMRSAEASTTIKDR